MDSHTVRYIFNYYSNLFSEREKKARRHHTTILKASKYSNQASFLRISKRNGRISNDPKVLKLLEDGYDVFEKRTASRILNESGASIFLNNCPKCKKLTRTPIARQCQHCNYDWHNIIVAKFKFSSAFEIAKGDIFIVGEIKSGLIKIGNYVDLVIAGLNLKPRISSIEFANYGSSNSHRKNDICLRIEELNEDRKESLKEKNEILLPLDILSTN